MGWQDPKNGMWQVPLIDNSTNLNVNILILDRPTKLEFLNSLYIVHTTKATRQHIQALMEYASRSLSAMEVINHIYKLPSIEQSIRYLHAAAGHPKLPTWLKAISQGNYTSWPLSHRPQRKKVLPRIRRNSTRAHERSSARSPQNAPMPHQLTLTLTLTTPSLVQTTLG